MGRAADLYSRVSPRFAHRPGSALPTRLHAWALRRSGGRIGKRFLGIPVLVLRTTGRRSGQQRESPMFFLPHGDGWAVMAANAASKRPPAWFLNLEAEPEAEALVDGGWKRVRGRRATAEEAAELRPRYVELYPGSEHYREIATRELPFVVLEPR
jgi:deazaflavin-dependent oxidoreductase (nitroreductase family)